MKVILDSNDRVPGFQSTHESCIWQLTHPIHNVSRFRVRQVIIPNTSPSFSASNNTLTIGGVPVSLSLTKRYTSSSSFVTDLNSAVTSVTIPNVSSLVFSSNADEGKLTMTWTASAPFVIKANKRFGNDLDVTYAAGTSQTFTFPHVYSLLPTKTIQLSSSSLATDDVRSSTEIGQVFACVPLKGAFGDLIVRENSTDDMMKLVSTASISRIHIILRDEDGQVINLQNSNWSIELEFL